MADENQNIIQPPVNGEASNQNYLNGENNNKYSTFITVLKVICIILMCILIFFEIMLEIFAFSDFEEERGKIEWSEQEKDRVILMTTQEFPISLLHFF